MIKKLLLLVLVTTFSLNSCGAGKAVVASKKDDSPRWVKSRPTTSLYFVGIANCSVWEDNYTDIAKKRALADMASEIEVDINVESIFNTKEEKGFVDESFSNTIKTKTAKSLQGYQTAGTWEGPNKYWVYYRLLKSDYYDLLKRNMEAAIRESEAAIAKAEEFENSFDYYQAVNSYLLSSKPIQMYLGEKHFPELKEKVGKLTNKAYTSISTLLTKIQIKSDNSKKLSLKTGEEAEIPLYAKLKIQDGGKLQPVKNFPVKYEFTTGNGTFNSNSVSTDSDGKSKGILLSLGSGEATQIINVKPDVETLLKDYEGQLIYCKALKNVAVNSDMYSVALIKTTLFIKSNEKNLGYRMNIPVIGPKLKEFLKDNGFEFANNEKEAVYLLKIDSDTRKGTSIFATNTRLYSAYLDMTISIVDTKTQKEIYTKPFMEIKGIKLNYKNAGISAYKKAVRILPKKVIPDLKSFFKIK